MPQQGSMIVTGVTGTGGDRGRDGEIVVNGFTHEVRADLDPITHKVTKQRTHSPLVVLKDIDFSSPALHKLQKEGTAVSVTLKLYHMPFDGGEFNYYTIRLKEAKIISMNLVMPDVNAFDLTHEWEEVSFVYKGIEHELIGLDAKHHEKIPYIGAAYGDPDGTLLANPIKFGPIWTEEKSKDAIKKAYEAAKDAAKKKFDEELKIYEQQQKKGK